MIPGKDCAVWVCGGCATALKEGDEAPGAKVIAGPAARVAPSPGAAAVEAEHAAELEAVRSELIAAQTNDEASVRSKFSLELTPA